MMMFNKFQPPPSKWLRINTFISPNDLNLKVPPPSQRSWKTNVHREYPKYMTTKCNYMIESKLYIHGESHKIKIQKTHKSVCQISTIDA